MPADSSINGQRPDVEQQDSSKSYALSGKIMLTSIITLFVVVVFLILLHLYARWYLHRLHRRRPNPRNRSTRIVYYIDSNRPLADDSPTGGLHASVLKSLPLFIYSPESGSNTPECAVCLSEFESGETGRVLPNCKHRFHTGCIDMWFFSNSTCPLCRSPVEPVQPEIPVLAEPGSSDSLGYLETTSSSSSDRRKRVDVTIDVPNRNNESVVDNEFRSPGSRLLSLKRIINMNRKSPVVSPSSAVGPSCVPVAAELYLESAGQESSRQGTGG